MDTTYILRALTEDDYQETGCSHVVATIGAAEVRRLLATKRLMERVRSERPELYRVEFWNGVFNPVLVATGEYSESLDSALRQDSVKMAPDGFTVPEAELEVSLSWDYFILVADQWGVSFRFCVKHEGTGLHAGDIPWESIVEAAKA